MKASKSFSAVLLKTIVLIFVILCSSNSVASDLYLTDGISAEINDTVVGSVIIENANVVMHEPAHIQGFVITASGAVLDIYGGQIDYMLLISTSDLSLPEGEVTVYGTDFAVDGIPVDPETTELFLQNQVLSGVYDTGTPFTYVVDCAISGNSSYTYYQTIKLGWLISAPDIELSQNEYDFGQSDIGTIQTGAISVYNLGNAALTIQSLQLEQDENSQFEFTPLQVMPLTLEPNTALDIEILYSPVVEGLSQAALQLTCNDSNDPVVQVTLSGEGIPVVLSPQEQISQLLDGYKVAVNEGTIQGVGNKKSAKNKVKVFGQMLSVADELLLAGYDEYALEALTMIEAKCDGYKSPKDFIKGSSAVELNRRLNEQIDALQQ